MRRQKLKRLLLKCVVDSVSAEDEAHFREVGNLFFSAFLGERFCLCFKMCCGNIPGFGG